MNCSAPSKRKYFWTREWWGPEGWSELVVLGTWEQSGGWWWNGSQLRCAGLSPLSTEEASTGTQVPYYQTAKVKCPDFPLYLVLLPCSFLLSCLTWVAQGRLGVLWQDRTTHSFCLSSLMFAAAMQSLLNINAQSQPSLLKEEKQSCWDLCRFRNREYNLLTIMQRNEWKFSAPGIFFYIFYRLIYHCLLWWLCLSRWSMSFHLL